MKRRALVVDDEKLIRTSLVKALEREGFDVGAAASGAEGLARFAEQNPDLVILDLRLGDADGLDVLQKMIEEQPRTKVILITAHGSVAQAVQAMKLGAFDFVKKPFELDEILTTARNAFMAADLEKRVEYLESKERQRANPGEPVFGTPSMQSLISTVEIVAAKPVPVVLVLGESGSGKDVIARRIHERSPRVQKSFVELNCSTIPEQLVESELFGHERGAFSDARERKLGLCEVADGGTLFLDEIGDLPLPLQAKFLGFLEHQTFRRVGSNTTQQVDVRVVAATNRPLKKMIDEGKFRLDLYYRLASVTLEIPPLRDRTDDLRPLCDYFLQIFNRQYGKAFRGMTPAALEAMRRYRWPGNVRELRAVLNRIVLLEEAELVDVAQLPREILDAALEPQDPRKAQASGAAVKTLHEVEQEYIKSVLALCGGNKVAAAGVLGIARQTLAKRLGDESDAG